MYGKTKKNKASISTLMYLWLAKAVRGLEFLFSKKRGGWKYLAAILIGATVYFGILLEVAPVMTLVLTVVIAGSCIAHYRAKKSKKQ